MPLNGHTIIDGDGHVIEDCQAIINFMPQVVPRQVRDP